MVPVLKTLRANGKIGIYKHHVALPGHHQLVLRDLVGRKTLPSPSSEHRDRSSLNVLSCHRGLQSLEKVSYRKWDWWTKITGCQSKGLGSLKEVNFRQLSRMGTGRKGIGPKIQGLFSSPAHLVSLGKAHSLYSFTDERGEGMGGFH